MHFNDKYIINAFIGIGCVFVGKILIKTLESEQKFIHFNKYINVTKHSRDVEVAQEKKGVFNFK